MRTCMNDWIDAILTIRPFVARKASRNACVTLNTPLRLIAMMSCQSLTTASGSAVNALRRLMPALLTRIETWPTSAGDLCCRRAAGRAVGDVEREVLRLAAFRTDVGCSFAGRFAVDVQHDHLRALAGITEPRWRGRCRSRRR